MCITLLYCLFWLLEFNHSDLYCCPESAVLSVFFAPATHSKIIDVGSVWFLFTLAIHPLMVLIPYWRVHVYIVGWSDFNFFLRFPKMDKLQLIRYIFLVQLQKIECKMNIFVVENLQIFFLFTSRTIAKKKIWDTMFYAMLS